MELLADGLLIVTALAAGLYCMALGRRLRKLTDSRGGIGPQIDSLDQALNETQTALAETRKSVQELGGSTSVAIAELTREAARGEDIAQRIERGIVEAKATLQRLYEAEGRIEASENRSAKAGDGENSNQTTDDEAGRDEPGAGGGFAASTKVTLPEGDVVELKEIEVLAPAPEAPEGSANLPGHVPSGGTAAQTGSVLKAERVVL
jgi:hypothetical protein